MNSSITRRQFIGASAAVSTTAAIFPDIVSGATAKPALLGGSPIRTRSFPKWPVIDQREDKALLEVLHSGKWFRGYGSQVSSFEKAYAKLMGAKYCVATANGTSALFASLGGLDIGPGDEVILPPYTFIATLNVIFLQYALPVFVDSDLETFQMDAHKLDAAMTKQTAAIIPVHLGGGTVDLDAVLSIAKKRSVPVIEDACQAHLAEWRNRRVGTWGDTGCFSFQASKNLNCGEGGAILTNDEELAHRCYAFHNNCRARTTASYNFSYLGSRGANLRLTEFQASLLLAQMTRLEAQSKTREENAQYLTRQLKQIPGIQSARTYDGCTRNAYHLYMFRYQPKHFADLPRDKFLRALQAEGIPCSGGYSPMNKEAFIQATLQSKGYKKIYPTSVLKNWVERNRCPANDKLCEEAVWFTQTMLLGQRRDMDDIVSAINKIRAHASQLAKS